MASSLTISQAATAAGTAVTVNARLQSAAPATQSHGHVVFSFGKFAGLSLRSHGNVAFSPKRRTRLDSSRKRVIKAAAVETLQTTSTALVEKSINTIRFLAIDAVEKANSGHPGLPMGCAPMGHILYDEVMKYNPKNPYFFNRDRFVLSAGHGCMLQYALLHLAGFDSVKIAESTAFVQPWCPRSIQLTIRRPGTPCEWGSQIFVQNYSAPCLPKFEYIQIFGQISEEINFSEAVRFRKEKNQDKQMEGLLSACYKLCKSSEKPLLSAS